MSASTNLAATSLAPGRTVTVFDEAPIAAGTVTRSFAIQSDSVLFAVYVGAVAGTVDISVATADGDGGPTTNVITFPTITSPSSELQLRKAAAVMGYIVVTVTYSGACDFTIKARGVVSSSEASVKILGQSSARNYHVEVTDTPSLLIPAALIDRSGLAIHNTDATRIVYMGFTLASTTTVDGWEIAPGEKLGLDVASGVDIYGFVLTGTTALKILEAGS